MRERTRPVDEVVTPSVAKERPHGIGMNATHERARRRGRVVGEVARKEREALPQTRIRRRHQAVETRASEVSEDDRADDEVKISSVCLEARPSRLEVARRQRDPPCALHRGWRMGRPST